MTYHEAKKPIQTPRGIESKAPIHRQTAIANSYSSTLRQPIPPPIKNPLPLINKMGQLLGILKSKDTPPHITNKWKSRMPELQQITVRAGTDSSTPEDIITLERAISEAQSDIESFRDKEQEQQDAYEGRIRKTLTSFGTINPSEWIPTGFYSLEHPTGICQLCGHHPIQNVYVITKTGTNQSLNVGSECVMNYLRIPIKKVDFDLKYDKDKDFEQKLRELNHTIRLLSDRNYNKDWQTRGEWDKRKELIDKYTKAYEKDRYLTDTQADKIIKAYQEAHRDLSSVQESADKKKSAHDVLTSIMEQSIPYHQENTFLKDIYNKWSSNYDLTERQITVFKSILEGYLSAKKTTGEKEGDNTITGIPTNFRLSSITTQRGSRKKIIFDIGEVTNISVVEWVRGFNDVEKLMNSKQDIEAKVTYILKGKFRNLAENGLQLTEEPEEDACDYSNVDISIFAPIKPRRWQLACFDKWWEQKIGVVQAGTGAGKTILGLMAIKKLLHEKPNGTVIISVPVIELQRQWKAECLKFGIPEHLISFVGGDGGQDTFGQITIGIINSLRNRELSADVYISDESHHMSDLAQQNFTVWNKQPFERMLFISATPGRIGEQIPVICKVTQDELQKEGSIVKYNITNIPIEMSSQDYDYYRQLTAEAEYAGYETTYGKMILGKRFRFVSNYPLKIKSAIDILKSICYNKAIVFFTTTASVDDFYDQVTTQGIPISKIHSKMSKKDRLAQYSAFAEGRTKILVGAFAIGEGINLPTADVAIIVGGTSQEREFIQRVGRVLRTAKDKESAQVFQIFIRGTMEEKWIKSRTLSVAKTTLIKTQ